MDFAITYLKFFFKLLNTYLREGTKNTKREEKKNKENKHI